MWKMHSHEVILKISYENVEKWKSVKFFVNPTLEKSWTKIWPILSIIDSFSASNIYTSTDIKLQMELYTWLWPTFHEKLVSSKNINIWQSNWPNTTKFGGRARFLASRFWQ